MRRVVVTGIGVVSCLGNNQEEVHQSLLNSKSGISFSEEYKEHNLKSHDKFKHKYKIKFDLLADEELKVLKKYKVWGKKKFMGREFMGIIRSTYLIDKKGKILKVWDNVKVKDHAKEVLKTLQNIVKK